MSCSNISLKKNISDSKQLRLGVVGFKITAPVKLKDIYTSAEGAQKINLDVEILRREQDAKLFFIQYMNSYYKDITTIDIPSQNIQLSPEGLQKIKEAYNVDALLIAEIPWYGKTNIMWPIIGLSADIAAETIILGFITKWNSTILLANLGWELVTNTPLWFGGSYLFGQAYKPVTIEAKLYDLNNNFKVYESDFEVTKSSHMLEKYPKKERKKIQNQLDASLKRALKELAIELADDDSR